MNFWRVQFIHLFHPSLNTCPYICTGRFINIPAPFPVVEWLSKASEVYVLRGPVESSCYWVLYPVSHGSVQGTVSHVTDISSSYMYECGILHLEDCSNYQYKYTYENLFFRIWVQNGHVSVLYLWLITECCHGGYNIHTPTMLPVSADTELFTYYHGNRRESHQDVGLCEYPTLGHCVSNWGTV